MDKYDSNDQHSNTKKHLFPFLKNPFLASGSVITQHLSDQWKPLQNTHLTAFGPRADLEFPATCKDEPLNKSSAISLLPSVYRDSWFGTTQVSPARNSRLIKSRTFVRSQMSVSIFLLIINFMSWGSFLMINVDKSDQ